MVSIGLIWFIAVLILGIVGTANAIRLRAFSSGWEAWFWEAAWIVMLRMTWPG